MTSRLSGMAFAFLVAMVFLLVNCASKPSTVDKSNDPQKNVSLANCKADPDPVTVVMKEDDTIVWTADANQGYTVSFATLTNPFYDTPFHVAPDRSHSSGKISLLGELCATFAFASDNRCQYKYTVKGDKGCASDPVVIVQK